VGEGIWVAVTFGKSVSVGGAGSGVGIQAEKIKASRTGRTSLIMVFPIGALEYFSELAIIVGRYPRQG
jgi:hypothetical protein